MCKKDKRGVVFFNLFLIVFCAVFFACVPANLTAQEPFDAKRGDGEHDSDEIPMFRVKVAVKLVSIYASVFDKKNHFVSGLDRSRFRVFEDGVEQKIESFSQEDVPVSMGIVLDLSSSMQGIIKQVKQSALTFLQAGKPSDEVFLVGFNSNVDLLHDYTGNTNSIRAALEQATLGNGTALYDAIYLSVKKAQSGVKPKKALIIISDGDDHNSHYSLKNMLDKVIESDVQVFCIGLFDVAYIQDASGVMSILERISKETGGKAFFPANTSKLDGIVEEIARELRGQYSIGYSSSNAANDGKFRKVKIELTGKNPDGIKIRHRNGYFADRK